MLEPSTRRQTIPLESKINKFVFFASTLLIFCITAVGSIWPGLAQLIFKAIQGWLIVNTSWIYVLAVGTIMFFAFWLMLSRLGEIKLGPDHSKPDYDNLSWFAMLFSAGMGIGLLFFGVAEPIMHFYAPPVGEPSSIASAREAMKITFFHWGLHAWSIYALFAVILAYFSYRKNLPLLPRSALYPFIGEKIFGPIGDLVDTFSVIGTMFGVATSLGLGVAQVNAGLAYLTGIPQTATIQVALIAGITFMAGISVVLGLDGGIKRLSNINMILAGVLLFSVLLMGDSVGLMRAYVQNTGSYLSDIVYKTFNLYAYERKESWIGGWTLLYWGWWISWSPFVGMFIARISRGRTIREFIVGVLFVPTGFTFLWMTVFGNSAIDLVLSGVAPELAETVSESVPIALFQFFEFFPFSQLLSLVGVMLVITFFVSSSDSGSLVIDTLTSGGAEEPPVWQRIYWAAMEGVVAAVLLLAGGLEALQTMTIASAFPMIFMLMIGCLGLFKSLRADYLLQSSVQHHQTTVQYSQASMPWKERLRSLVSHPNKEQVETFLHETARPALEELAEEFGERGLEAEVKPNGTSRVRFVVLKDGIDDFLYGIRPRPYVMPTYVEGEEEVYYRAEVFLAQGGQEYDVYGYTKEQIIVDAVTQYEKHLHFIHLATADTPDDVQG